jgi:hypothetical protein
MNRQSFSPSQIEAAKLDEERDCLFRELLRGILKAALQDHDHLQLGMERSIYTDRYPGLSPAMNSAVIDVTPEKGEVDEKIPQPRKVNGQVKSSGSTDGESHD